MSTSRNRGLLGGILLVLAASLSLQIAIYYPVLADWAHYYYRRAKPSPLLTIGSPLLLHDIGWSAAEKTIVLAINESCPACNASLPLYQKIGQVIRHSGVRFIIVSSEARHAVQRWLSASLIEPDDIRHVDALGPSGLFLTPSLAIVDRKGVVVAIWFGKPSEEKVEGEIIPWIRYNIMSGERPKSDGDRLPQVTLSVLSMLAEMRPVVLVDMQDRGRFVAGTTKGISTVNIPRNEFPTRAPIELPKSAAVAVDCDAAGNAQCLWAGVNLLDLGFKEILLVVKNPYR
jgi:hypothetical protein